MVDTRHEPWLNNLGLVVDMHFVLFESRKVVLHLTRVAWKSFNNAH
jgi:hypothetical protein